MTGADVAQLLLMVVFGQVFTSNTSNMPGYSIIKSRLNVSLPSNQNLFDIYTHIVTTHTPIGPTTLCGQAAVLQM